MNCQGLLLTYQSFRTAAVWPAFKAWVRAEAQSWRARYHGATMEFNDPARAGPGDVRHLHLMLPGRARDVGLDVQLARGGEELVRREEAPVAPSGTLHIGGKPGHLFFQKSSVRFRDIISRSRGIIP